MGSRLKLRDAVTEKFMNHFDGRDDCLVVYENGANVDMNHSTVPVIGFEIIYKTSEQGELAANPLLKDDGEILVTVLVKDMSGNRKAYALRDEAAELLQRQYLAGANLWVSKLLPNSYAVKGWVAYRAAVPFKHYHH